MKNKYFLLLALAFFGTSVFAQTTVWVAEGEASNWNVVESWRDGVKPDGVTKTVFNVPNGADCVIDTDDAIVKQLVMGDNQPYGGTLIIQDGGVLTCSEEGDWSTVGYNEAAQMSIEAGGKLIVNGNRFHVGLVDPNAADIAVNLDVAGSIVTPKFTVNDGGKAWNATCYVFDGGMIETNILWVGTGGLIDVSGGTIIVTPNEHAGASTIATVNEIVGDGRVTAEGGDEAPTVEISADSVITITSSTTVGIADRQAAQSTIGIYPNPASDVVYFKNNTVANVSVYAITGQLVLRKQQVSQINVETLKPGYYILKGEANNTTFVEKLYKK